MVDKQTDMALGILKSLSAAETEGNYCVSPVSIEVCLGMLTNGAVDNTRQSLLDLFGAKDVNELNSFNRLIYTHLSQANPSKVKFESKQAFWGNSKFNINPDYARLLEKEYEASTFLLDFSKVKMKNVVNTWINDNTHGLIPEFIKDEIEGDKQSFILANTVYFKGAWYESFEAADNTIETFNAGSPQAQDVTMMNRVGAFGYHEGDNYESYELQYGSLGEFRIYFILPDEGVTVDELIGGMTASKLKESRYMEPARGRISIPKFDVESNMLLDRALGGLGLDISGNELSGIGDAVGVQINHGTHVIVNEAGTEAAAVTTNVGLIGPFPEAKDFKINRPFVFVILERCTGACLFIGKVSEIK